MKINYGLEAERRMKKWFRGTQHPAFCVDFQTSRSVFEVKSCRLLNKTTNGNDKRKFKGAPHKRIRSTKVGRFELQNKSHSSLLEVALRDGKIPRYVFVIKIGRQYVWRTKTWEEVDLLIDKGKDRTSIHIRDIFGWNN